MSSVIPGPGYGPLEGAVEKHGTPITGSAGSPANSQPLHVVSQENQGYGSRRRCCSYCGAMCWPGMEGSATRFVGDWAQWQASPDRCELRKAEAS